MVVTCPNCNHSGELPSNVKDVPRRMNCSKCGIEFDLRPDSPDEERLFLAQPEREPKAAARIDAGNLKIDKSGDQSPLQTMLSPMLDQQPLQGEEPWCYRFLAGWGILHIVIAGLMFLSAMIAVLFGIIGRRTENGIGIALGICLAATVPISFAAVIFLIVDMARNLRRLTIVAEKNGKASARVGNARVRTCANIDTVTITYRAAAHFVCGVVPAVHGFARYAFADAGGFFRHVFRMISGFVRHVF